MRIAAPLRFNHTMPPLGFRVPIGFVHGRALAGLGEDPTGTLCADGSVMDASGVCGGGVIDIPIDVPPVVFDPLPPLPPSSTSLTPAQITALLNGAAGAVHAAQTPYVIPGTNVVYNPATGQVIGSPVGVTASQVGASLTPMFLIAAIGLVLVLSSMKK